MTTRFVDEHAAELVAAAASAEPERNFATSELTAGAPRAAGDRSRRRRRKARRSDPLAVLDHGKGARGDAAAPTTEPARAQLDSSPDELDAPDGTFAVRAPMQGTIVSVDAREGDAVAQGQPLLVMEAMKMEHVIAAPASGIVRGVAVAKGDAVFEGHALVLLEAGGRRGRAQAKPRRRGPRITSARISRRCSSATRSALDERRPDAVARRRKTGQRTARENIERPAAIRARSSSTGRSCRRAAPAPHDGRPDRATRPPTAWSPASAA